MYVLLDINLLYIGNHSFYLTKRKLSTLLRDYGRFAYLFSLAIIKKFVKNFCFVLYLPRKTWKPVFLKDIRPRSFKTFFNIYGFRKNKFCTRRLRYGGQMFNISEKYKPLLSYNYRKFWFFHKQKIWFLVNMKSLSKVICRIFQLRTSVKSKRFAEVYTYE